ncbi:MAG TPA: hypothetical protein VK779_10290 [Rhizomicrobium sp.]|jgi:hypothetical protein|nr:hypothetical protein [Rhizomicrobium sp.]
MAQEIHYEIFLRMGAKGGWSLHDVMAHRESALETAADLMAREKAVGVKVVKETYSTETGDYLSLKIFEDGHTQMKMEAAAEDVPHALPCFKPEDLYLAQARATIARLLSDYLARHKLTVTELIHRADMLEKLEATGTMFQHAIQKIAVAQASTSSTPVQHIIKSLNDLATKAVNRVYRDARNNAFPKIASGGFGKAAEKLARNADGAYLLNAGIAQYLADAKNWDAKLSRLLALMDEAPVEGEGRTLLLSCIDALVAELLSSSAALTELIGPEDDLGHAILDLIRLFTGEAQDKGAASLGLLAQHFAKDDLPDARMAIANRILAEIKSVKRLSHASLDEELRLLRHIANNLVLAQGKYLAHEDMIAAFTLRSRRLIVPESIGEYLEFAASPDGKLERLLHVEENIIGHENKRNLGAFVVPVVTSAAFETYCINTNVPALQRLKRLADLQDRVRRSTFHESQRREIAGVLDRVACLVEAQVKLLDSIAAKASTPAEMAVTILKLCTGGMLTEGKLSARARELVVSSLSRPGFLTGYVAHLAQHGEKLNADAAMSELMQTLQKAGITPETGLKSIAA